MKVKHKMIVFERKKSGETDISAVFSFLELDVWNHKILITIGKGDYETPFCIDKFIISEPCFKRRTSESFKNYFLKQIIEVDYKGCYMKNYWQKIFVYPMTSKVSDLDIVITLLFGFSSIPEDSGYLISLFKTLWEYDLSFSRSEGEGIREKFNSFCRSKETCFLWDEKLERWYSLHEINSSIIFRKTFEDESIL